MLGALLLCVTSPHVSRWRGSCLSQQSGDEHLLHALSRTSHQAQPQQLMLSHVCERVLYSTAGGGGAAHHDSQAYGAKSMY